MKIALAQQNYHIGNFEYNTVKIIEAIDQAKKQEADLIVFSELAVCGYPPRDFLEFEDFINQCYHAIDLICQHADTIGVIVGCPQRNPIPQGKDLFNAAWLLYEKEIKEVIHKTCLPNYDVFDEYRYFEPAYDWKIVPFKGKKIALTICEDIWSLGDNPLYRICPMDKLIVHKPDMMINISASPFDYDHDAERREIVRTNVLKYKLPMFYCNTIGSKTEIHYINLLDEDFLKSPYYYIYQNDVIIVPPLKQRSFRKYFTQNAAIVLSAISIILVTYSLINK